MSLPRDSRSIVVGLGRQFIALLFIAAAAAALAYAVHPHRPSYDATGPAEINLADIPPTESVLWIDARPPTIFAAAHIPGAISLSEDAWESSLPAFVEAWQPGRKIIVYCDSLQCRASEAVARRLVREFNATNVHVLKGGWQSWLSRK